jgi:hypothetical protein
LVQLFAAVLGEQLPPPDPDPDPELGPLAPQEMQLEPQAFTASDWFA